LFDERVVIVIVMVMKRGVRMRVSCFIDTRLEVISVALGPKKEISISIQKRNICCLFYTTFCVIDSLIWMDIY
jgi:hypothetical protein